MPEKNVQLNCKGRGNNGEEVLGKAVLVTIRLSQSPGTRLISVGPQDCPYNTGGHGQRCKASHPNHDKVGVGVGCPFSFDFPYVLEVIDGWEPPRELREAIAADGQLKGLLSPPE